MSESHILLGDDPRRSPPRWRWAPIGVIPLLLMFGMILRVPLQENIAQRLHMRKSSTGHRKNCESDSFRDETLKLIHEAPMAWLDTSSAAAKYEASDVAGIPDSEHFFVVSDNTYGIARLGLDFVPRVPALLKWRGYAMGDSQFEFLAYNKTAENFVVGVETFVHTDGNMKAQTYDVTFGKEETQVGTKCVAEFTFEAENKGFEGAYILGDYLLALCEGNHCKGGKKGMDNGHGRIVVMKRSHVDGKCIYEKMQMLHIPSMADFQDYSALTVWKGHQVAIASQENSAIFVAEIAVNSEGTFRFVEGTGKIYDFPRNDECEIKYCNVEGLLFVGAKRLVAVSDAMKSRGRQHFRCREKDQSVHLMQLP